MARPKNKTDQTTEVQQENMETSTNEIVVNTDEIVKDLPEDQTTLVEEIKTIEEEKEEVKVVEETTKEITCATILEDFILDIPVLGYNNVYCTVNFKKGDVITEKHVISILKKTPRSISFE